MAAYVFSYDASDVRKRGATRQNGALIAAWYPAKLSDKNLRVRLETVDQSGLKAKSQAVKSWSDTGLDIHSKQYEDYVPCLSCADRGRALTVFAPSAKHRFGNVPWL